MMAEIVVWSGELLWPQDLPEGPSIDMSEVRAVGVWLHDWFRRRPQVAVIGADDHIRRQFQIAGVPVLWYRSAAEVLHSGDEGGVTPSEREMLWS